MDFQSLSRKELQTLCKKNKIPANITNVAMAEALAALPQVEGLDEFLNPREGDVGTPDVHHRTACRTSTQRKAVKDAKVAETPAVLPSSRRRVAAVSTRRKKEVDIMLEDDDADKNGGVQGKPTDVPKTPAAVASRSRATGRSVCSKNETPGGTSVQRTYNTRRSVRLLEKSLSKMSLIDTEDIGVSEDLSSVSQHVEDSSETEKGASLQTVSAVVSENTDELEVSSLNKADFEGQSQDSGSELKLVSGTENGAEDGLQAEPQDEGSGKVNHMEAEASFETYDDLNEAGSELLPELEESCDSAELENKECIGTKQDALSVEVSEEASMEVADQDMSALTVAVPDDACKDGPDQDVAGLLCVSSVNDASVSLKELVECNIDNQGSNEGDDDNQEKNNVGDDDSNYIQNFEPMHDDVDEQDVAVPDDACKDGPDQDVAGLLCVSSVNDASVSLKELVECNIDNQGSNEGDDDNQEKNNVGDDDSNYIQNFEPMHDDVDEQAADKKDVSSSEGVLEPSIFSSSGENQEEVLEPKPEHSEESREEIEKIEYISDVTGASSAILAGKDESSGISGAVNEVCTESFADEKESMEVENVILQLSLLGVGVHKAEDQDTSEKLEAEVQAEERAAGEGTKLDAANAFSSVLDGTCGKQVSVESVGNFMDSCSSDALKSNTVVDGDTDVISEDIAIPKQEYDVSAETMTVIQIHEQKTNDIAIESETKEIASEIQTVPKMISIEDGMPYAMMKENLTTAEEFHNMSLRGLKKMLKKFDGKSNNTTNNDVVHVQEVQRKRTALQALSQNQMTTGEAQNDV